MSTKSPWLGIAQSVVPFVLGFGLSQGWFTSAELSAAVNLLTQGGAIAVAVATAISSALTTVTAKP